MPSFPNPNDPSVDWFIEQLAAIRASKDWLSITMRVGTSVEQASDEARYIANGANLSISQDERRARIQALLAAHDRIVPAVAHVAESVRYNGDDIPLRGLALTAASHAMNALVAGADLDRRLFRSATQQFDGFISFNERPTRHTERRSAK